MNAEPGTVPFAIAFDPFGHLVIAEAGPNALATFDLSRSGTVSVLSQAGTGQAAACWVTLAGSFLIASNAGTPSESGFTSSASGQLSLLGNTATDPGAVDAASAAGGRFLYVQTGGDGGWADPPEHWIEAAERRMDAGSLSARSRRRFEAHLADCPHCTGYLAQMRETISLTGRLEPEDLTPQMRDEFTDLYRRWRSEQQ